MRGLLLLVVAFYLGCAATRVMVNNPGEYKAVDPATVKAYFQAPRQPFEVIGVIEGEAADTSQSSVDALIAKMKRNAAKYGAQGIIIESTGKQWQSGYVPMATGGGVPYYAEQTLLRAQMIVFK